MFGIWQHFLDSLWNSRVPLSTRRAENKLWYSTPRAEKTKIVKLRQKLVEFQNKSSGKLQNVGDFVLKNVGKTLKFATKICWIVEVEEVARMTLRRSAFRGLIPKVQRNVDPIDLVKSFLTSIWLRNLASLQPVFLPSEHESSEVIPKDG